MLYGRALPFVVLFSSLGCSEALTMESPTRDAAADSSAPQVLPRTTIRSLSNEIDLSAVDDRAIGFAQTGEALVASSGTRRTSISTHGIAITLDRQTAPFVLGHAGVLVAEAHETFDAHAVDADARARRRSEHVEEIIESRIGVVEQRWRFHERPAGAITVRVPIEGARLDHADARGLHLSVGETRIVYSHARWIDAGGASTEVPAVLEDGVVVLHVSEELLRVTRFPAVLDPTIGPEIPVSSAPSLVRDSDYESSPAVTQFGTRTVALWQTKSRIGCAYIDASESAVTRAPKMLTPTIPGLYGARVARSGNIAIAVIHTQSNVQYVRFDSSCVALDATPRMLTPSSISNIDDVSPYDGGFLVTWSPTSTSRHIRAISLDGTVQWTAPTTLTDVAGNARNPKLLASGTDVVVLYRVGVSLRAQRMTTSGTFVSPAPVVLDTGAVYASNPYVYAARNSSVIVASWDGGSATRNVATFDPSTLGLITSRPASLFSSPGLPVVELVGAQVVLTGLDSADSRVRIRRLDPATLVPQGVDAVSTTAASYEGVWDVATDGAGTVVTIQLLIVDQERDVFLFRSDATATEFRLSMVAPIETRPQVASTGTGFMTAWARSSPTPSRIRAAYVSSAGVVSPSAGIDVSTANDLLEEAPFAHDIAASDTHYLLAYDTRFDIGAQLYATQSTVPTEPFPSDVSGRRLACVEVSGQLRLAYVTDESISARWRTAASPTNESGIYAASTVVGPFAAAHTLVAVANAVAIVVSTSTAQSSSLPVVASDVSLAYSGTEYLLTWATAAGAITTRRVSSTGQLLGANVVVRASGSGISGLSTVWDGSRYVVAYVSGGAVLAHRIDVAGLLVDAVPGTIQADASAESGVDMAADDAGRVMVVYGRSTTVDDSATIRVYGRIVDFGASGADGNGTACAGPWNCASGICADGVCCDRACGGGSGTCEACSVAAGGPTDGTCSPKANGTSCRASAGPCDVAETCDGASSMCPSNAFASGNVCNAAGASLCDVADTCDGTMAGCPARYAPMGTTCRASLDVCDIAEVCSGVSAACPSDGVATTAVTCRPSVGTCDIADTCNGASKACPTNALRSASFVCRASTSTCDQAEYCPGNGVDCPSDAAAPSTTLCRSATSPCNPADFCDGVSRSCPSDVPAPATTLCRGSSGTCDATEYCTGAHLDCPADAPAPQGTSCRGVSGPCDAEEVCNGVSRVCPLDIVRPVLSVCRTARGECDAVERCSGISKECPIDKVQSAGTLCRGSTGPCDIAESCDGEHSSCLEDGRQRDGVSCDDGLVCNGEALCSAGECVPSEPLMCEPDLACDEIAGRCIATVRSSGCSTSPSTRADFSPLAFLLGVVLMMSTRRRSR